jgi:hypothetical protein
VAEAADAPAPCRPLGESPQSPLVPYSPPTVTGGEASRGTAQGGEEETGAGGGGTSEATAKLGKVRALLLGASGC